MHEEKEASKRPEDSDFKQQRLPAWQPLLTPKWVILTFFVVGAVFLPIGVVIVNSSEDVVELSRRYDHLEVSNDCTGNNLTSAADCSICLTFEVEEDMEQPVYLYYELSNYYQNHRRYVKSRSDTQLRGDSGDTGTCTPLESNSNGTVFYPCGLIANSFFNDTFELCDSCATDGNGIATGTGCSGRSDITGKGIAWQSDIDHKFKLNEDFENNLATIGADGVTRLPSVDDEETMVWMRTAGLPTFRKLHRKITRDLKKGETLSFKVANVYPVDSFDGEKRLVLSTTSWLGGKNRFLGWSYVAVSVVCLCLGIAFLIKNRTSPRKLGDMHYFQWAGAGAAAGAGSDDFAASS